MLVDYTFQRKEKSYELLKKSYVRKQNKKAAQNMNYYRWVGFVRIPQIDEK